MSGTQQSDDGAQTTNDVTKMYDARSELGAVKNDLKDDMPELFDHNGGATVTGEGSTGHFVRGWWDGEDDVTVSVTFTIDMEVPAWKVEVLRDAFDAVDADVELDVSGSTSRGAPLWKDGRMVAAKSVPDDLDPDEDVTHTATVTVTKGVTDDMQGIPADLIYEGCVVTDPEDPDKRGDVQSVTGDKALVYWGAPDEPDTHEYAPVDQFALISQPQRGD